MMFHDFGDGGGFTSCAFFDMLQLQYLPSNLTAQDPLQALPVGRHFGNWVERVGEEAAGDERAWLHGCKGVAGNGWGERAWKMVACRLAMCAYRLTDKIDAKGWG